MGERDARRTRATEKKHRIVVLAFDRVTLSDIAGPVDVFHLTRDLLEQIDAAGRFPRYELIVASLEGGPITASSGLQINTTALSDLAECPIDTLIVPGGGPPSDPPIPPALVDWLRHEGDKPERICAVCTGIFLVAEAGLADGLRATTHWQAARALAKRFPQILVEADPIFLRDGKLWSSAGFTAGLDLALALLEQDYGHNAAIQMARNLVMFMKRPGGQSQFSAPLASQAAGDVTFDKLHAWIMDHLSDDLPVARLAEQAGMAPRTFFRRYVAQIGRTPAKTIELFRLEAACRQLRLPNQSLKQVALASGFGDEQNLRRAFVRCFGVIPQQFRDRFGSYTQH
ncbi:GlxA family transcriptional regulator [Sphingobium sp. B2]|uniref:GlxA family transcriptional regulator n=1 Tax=Sphingobium sp. B2 TaxID=2583228 RepID=UPI0011A61972|nr:DJ-1/PfpI family protein [Sphingobium sp. B2]